MSLAFDTRMSNTASSNEPISSAFILENISSTAHLAHLIAAQCKVGDVITLSGDLGVGKTTFAQAFVSNFIGQSDEVLSPTFTLMHKYETKPIAIWHCDFYRIESPDELDELGLDEVFTQGISLIEWPEVAANQLPESRLDIELQFVDDSQHPDARLVIVKGYGEWIRFVRLLEQSSPLTQVNHSYSSQ